LGSGEWGIRVGSNCNFAQGRGGRVEEDARAVGVIRAQGC